MSIKIIDITEEDCTVCNCTFDTNEIQSLTTDDFNCCSNCSSELNKYKYVVWVGGVDDYYTDYGRAKEHYDEWIAKGYDDVTIQEIGK